MKTNRDQFQISGINKHFFHGQRFLRAQQAANYFGIGKSTWWAWVKKKKAPPGILLGKRTRVWGLEEIQQLAEELLSESVEEE